MSKEACNHGTNLRASRVSVNACRKRTEKYIYLLLLFTLITRRFLCPLVNVVSMYALEKLIFQKETTLFRPCHIEFIYHLQNLISHKESPFFLSCHKYQTILWYMTEDRNLSKISNIFWWAWRWCVRIETTFITGTSRKGNMEKELRGKLANVSGRRNELSLRIQLFQQFSWEHRTTGPLSPLSPLSSPPLSRNARCSVNADRCEREASCGEISCRETLAFINIHRELFVERNS